MARRGENIRKRKDNRWEGRYTACDEKGVRRSCSVYAKSYSECKEKLKQAKEGSKPVAEAANQASAENGDTIRFDMIAGAWLAEIQKAKKGQLT